MKRSIVLILFSIPSFIWGITCESLNLKRERLNPTIQQQTPVQAQLVADDEPIKESGEPTAPEVQIATIPAEEPRNSPCPIPCPKPKPVCNPCVVKESPCQRFQSGLAINESCLPAAYSKGANIDPCYSKRVFVTGSYIYWDVIEDGLDIGGLQTFAPGTLTVVDTVAVVQNRKFTSGFKVGLGWHSGLDDWTLYSEYTRLHGKTHNSADPSNGGIYPIWLPATNPPVSVTSLSSKWIYDIDLIKAQVSRPFYLGTHLVVEPCFGLAAAFIKQKLNIEYGNTFVVSTLAAEAAYNVFSAVPYAADVGQTGTLNYLAAYGINASGNPATTSSLHRSKSWGIGPHIGINGNWFLGCSGVRFIGNGYAELLVTRYQVTETRISPTTAATAPLPKTVRLKNYYTLRPIAGLATGLGWGAYLGCNEYYVDLSATYEFNIFWNQNMMRALLDKDTSAAGDLFTHGLTVTARFDF